MKHVNVFVTSFLIITVLCGCRSSTPLEENDWTIAGLSGKVKTITQRSYQTRDQRGNWIKGPANQTYSIKNIDENGFNVDEHEYFVNDNTLYGGSSYEYDSEKNLAKINRIGGDNSIVGYTDIVERVGKLRPSKYDNYFVSPDETTMTGSSEMLWDGYQVKESSFYDKDGKLVSKSTTTYYENNNIDEFSTLRTAQNQNVTLKYTYQSFDDQGNWTSALKEIIGFNRREIVERVYEYYSESN